MKNFFFCFSLLILLFSFAGYQILQFIGYFIDSPLYNEDLCITVPGIMGAEDIVNYKGIGLAGSDDRAKLWYSGDTLNINELPNGHIYGIYPSRGPEKVAIRKIPIQKFPQEISFHPHGLSLYKNLLYVINHAYGKGGERIEVLEIHDSQDEQHLQLIYRDSILMEENSYGMYNDLMLLNENEFYITTWLPIPHSVKGVNLKETFWIDIKRILYSLFFKDTFIKFCNIQNKQAVCSKLPQTASSMNNGIAYNGNDLVLAAKPIEKTAVLYRLQGRELIFLKEFKTNFVVDNIDFDKETNAFFLSGMIRTLDFLLEEQEMKKNFKLNQLKEIKSGIEKIAINKNINEMKSELLFVQNDVTGASIGVKFKDYYLIGTPFYDGIAVCID